MVFEIIIEDTNFYLQKLWTDMNIFSYRAIISIV